MQVQELEVAESPAETSVELLREFERTGRPEPFEAFMRRHASMVYATCLKVTRDPHDAEDATQATFLTLASKSRLNGEIRQPEAWLRKVAHRLSLDLIRSKKRRINRENVRSEMTTEEAPLDSHDHADKGEVKGILNEELQKLPASYRMPLILHYFGGLSRDEMAEQLKLKPSTLGVRLHRAREQLRTRLAKRGILLPGVALTALLTDVVHQSVCGHLMTSTAKQASAIALGQTTFHAAAPAMFAPTTGVDSLGALIGMLSHGKLKLLLSAVVLASTISLTSAQVRDWIPKALRSVMPSLKWPALPRFELPTPRPTLSLNAEPPASATEAVPTVGWSAPAPAPARPLLTRKPDDFVARPIVVTGSGAIPRLAPRSPALATSSREGVLFDTTFASVKAAPQPMTSTRSTQVSFQPQAFASAGPDVSELSSATPVRQASTPNSDAWNNVLPDREALAEDSAGPAIPTGDGAGTALDDVPARAIAAVTGTAPSVTGGSGTGQNALQSLATPPKAGDVFSSSTQLRSHTAVFSGTSANYGGFADDRWQPTELDDVSQVLTDASVNESLSEGPGVPGETLSINGARVTLHSSDDVMMNLSFVDTSATSIPALPAAHRFIGVWELDSDGTFQSADLLVRYDDLRAARMNLNEQLLKLWVSDGTDWQLLWLDPSFGRDVTQNLIWVTAPGEFKFFAVSAPEPAMALSLLGLTTLLTRRSRR